MTYMVNAGPGMWLHCDACSYRVTAVQSFLTADLKTARLAISAGRCLFPECQLCAARTPSRSNRGSTSSRNNGSSFK